MGQERGTQLSTDIQITWPGGASNFLVLLCMHWEAELCFFQKIWVEVLVIPSRSRPMCIAANTEVHFTATGLGIVKARVSTINIWA